MQKLHYPKIGGFEKNITQGFNRIRLVAESLNLNHQDVKNMAFEYLKRIEDNKLLKGKSLDAKVAVVIFMAARNTQKRKKIDDILRYVNTTKSEINKCFKKCKDIIIDKRIQPSHIVETTCIKLNLSPEVLRAAKQTADNFTRLAICEGKRPQTIAGVSLFMVSQLIRDSTDDI